MMVNFKVGDKVRFVGGSMLSKSATNHETGRIFEIGNTATISEVDEVNGDIRLNYGIGNWVKSKDVILYGGTDLEFELAHEMNKTYDLWERNSNLLDEMVDMVEQLGLLKGDVIDDRLVTNFADRYLGGF